MQETQALSGAAIAKLARLSRLLISPSEAASLAHDMQRILTYVDHIKALAAEALQPAASGDDNVWREDVVQASMPVALALQNAPERLGDGFGVPKIIE